MRVAPETTPIERAVRRRQNLLVAVTSAGLLALLALLSLTPLAAMVCEAFELYKDYPTSMLGRAYWNDCFGGPLGTLAAGPPTPKTSAMPWKPTSPSPPWKTWPPKKTKSRTWKPLRTKKRATLQNRPISKYMMPHSSVTMMQPISNPAASGHSRIRLYPTQGNPWLVPKTKRLF